MKKILFIDRDGTLIMEPQSDFQVDSFEKLCFYPYAIQYLSRIVIELDYMLVMVTNQDGLGTSSFPEDSFWPVQNFMINTFKNEGIVFDEIFIDKTFAYEKAATRKPGTAMLAKYIYGQYDMKNSYVIGDRITDVELAKNLGCKSILMADKAELGADFNTVSWEKIYKYLKGFNRCAFVHRKTKETDIKIEINLHGSGISSVHTGLPFFNHMLDQLAKHGQLDLTVIADGDLYVDEHHTIEDTGIALGEAFFKALENKKGFNRYGFCLPMDDSLSQVAIDFGGRPWIVWNATFKREKIGEMPTEMFYHFFKSFSDNARCNLNISASGENEHHKIESIFKAFARAIKMAIEESQNYIIPSTKGLL